jgi:hypothetical protein|tara:strand:+ start:3984 stop:4211 length:228 start_codon:yes stop_codon:yes gene_type:complete
MNSIKETFKARSSWVNHRASAIFLCYLNKKNLNNFKSKFISWKLLNTSGNVEVVWLSWNKKNMQFVEIILFKDYP